MTVANPTLIGPSPLDLGTAFCSAKVLLSALEVDLFSELAAGPATAEEVQAKVGLHPRGARHFLDALVVLGLLERSAGRYHNGAYAGRYLVRGPEYAGGFLDGANHVLYPAWGGLTAALRTGRPQATGDLEEMLRDPDRRRGYLTMMDSLSGPLAEQIADACDWRRFATLADIGGARGNLAGLLLNRFPQLTATVFDRPQNGLACEEHRRNLGVAERLSFRGGDFFADALPQADILVIGHVLADFSPEQRRTLVRKAYQAVRPGGALLIYDPMPDEQAPELTSLVASLHLLVMTPAGSAYPVAECRSWLTDSGFVGVTAIPARLGNTIVVGQRAG
ncbi:methyltransferase [Micromonospora sp. LOL_021]|uniref:methyltransferase n=1 Tax=Micromonospora sp. LOL_021 TaxID=3345417 RepID=UPI003A89AD56